MESAGTGVGTTESQASDEVITTAAAATEAAEGVTQGSSMVPDTTAATVRETETTLAATTDPTTETPRKAYTVHMGRVTPMSGTIMVDQMGTMAPTTGNPITDGEDGEETPEEYDD